MRSFLSKKTWLFLLILGLFLIQDILQDRSLVFKYFDEAFALTLIPVAAFRLIQKRKLPTLTKNRALFAVLLVLFFLSGWTGFFAYRYQPLKQALMDSYVNIKFFLAVAATLLIFDDDQTDIDQLRRVLWPVVNKVTVVLSTLCITNLFFDIFPVEMRGPLRAIRLFYSSYTVLVGICTLLAAIYLWYFAEKKREIIPYLLRLCFIMYFTRRVKGIGAIACILLVYLFILLGKVKLSRKVKIAAGVVVGLAGIAGLYQLVSYYITMGIGSARAMLTLAAPFVAWDHFPFGSGWGTFGSAFSGDPYSPVYGMYRMAGIWGMSPKYHAFISDTYWPMIMGQCGYFGFAALLGVLYLFVRRLLRLKPNTSAYGSVVFILLYLLISSTSESALANPIAMPLAFWLGFLLAQQRIESRKAS